MRKYRDTRLLNKVALFDKKRCFCYEKENKPFCWRQSEGLELSPWPPTVAQNPQIPQHSVLGIFYPKRLGKSRLVQMSYANVYLISFSTNELFRLPMFSMVDSLLRMKWWYSAMLPTLTFSKKSEAPATW